MKLSSMLVDSDAVENGDVVLIMKGEGGESDFKVHVRGYQNADYVRRQREMLSAAQAEIGLAAVIPDEKSKAIDLALLCETVLVGWEGLVDDDGKEIPYSPEKAIEILGDPDARQLRTRIENAAAQMSSRRKKKVDDAAKN